MSFPALQQYLELAVADTPGTSLALLRAVVAELGAV